MRPRPAYSLIFAFLVMTVILIISTTTIENTTEKMAYFREMEGATQAKLAAQSAAELAIVAIKDYNAGYSLDLTTGAFTADPNGDGTDEATGDYTVYSNAETNDNDGSGLFYTPIPGTGSAGDPNDCSILNDDEDVDHPCNWNKLLYGDSVTIPLYTDDGSGNIMTIADIIAAGGTFDGWYLKVRTPCMDGSLDDEGCARYTFDEADSDPDITLSGGDSVVLWQLVGSDEDGNSVSLIPDDYREYGTRTGAWSRDDPNTEIYESSINDGYEASGDYIVLEATNTAPYTDIYQICTDTSPDYTVPLSTLSLQLNIVTPLIDASTGDPFPYLEWQLAMDISEGLADTKAVIVGEGYYEAADKTFYYPFVVTRSTTGESTSVYTLSN